MPSNLVEVQACPAVRRRLSFRVPSVSAQGTEYEVEALIVQGQVRCSCPGFKFRGTCAHTKLTEERCGWQAGVRGAEDQTPEQQQAGVCPRCGSPTILVVVREAAPDDDDSEAALLARGVFVPAPPTDGR